MAESKRNNTVYVYDLYGKRVGEGPVSEVSKKYNVPIKSVYAVSDGRRGAANGYMFSWSNVESMPEHASVVVRRPKICSVDGCSAGGRSTGADYCDRHYKQVRNHGRILRRGPKDPNEYVVKEDHAEVFLYGVDSERPVERFIVDVEDLEDISKFVWGWIRDTKYVLTRPNGKTLYLHRYLMDCYEDGLVVDHINGNPLDNRKSNLRVTNQQGNTRNRHDNPKNYYYNNARGVWCVNITIDNKSIYLGSYATEQEAQERAREAREKYYHIEEF